MFLAASRPDRLREIPFRAFPPNVFSSKGKRSGPVTGEERIGLLRLCEIWVVTRGIQASSQEGTGLFDCPYGDQERSMA